MIELPTVEGGFGCVVADPPWEFNNKRTRAAAADHYEEMSRRDIECMRVEDVAAENGHLYLWTTDAHLAQAIILAKLWSFEPKMTVAWVKTKAIETRLYTETEEDGTQRLGVGHFLTREPELPTAIGTPPEVKLQIGLGNYYRHAHELILFCTRGKAPARVKNFPSVIFAPRQEHSQKPEILQTLAEQMSPGPGLELFATRQRQYWQCWMPKAHRVGAPVLTATESISMEVTP